MKKVLILAGVCMYTLSTSAQRTSNVASGFGDELKSRVATNVGSSFSSRFEQMDPNFSFLYTYSPTAIGFTVFGNTNLLRRYGTVGAGLSVTHMTNPKDVNNVFLGQVTVGAGVDLYSKSEFETLGVPKDNQGTGLLSKIGAASSLNVLMYGTTINNKEKGGVTIEGYLRIGKLASPIGWVQAQYNVFDKLGVSLYYSNDFGVMGGIVIMPDEYMRIFLGSGPQGCRISLNMATF